MTKLEPKPTNDLLFKMLFTKNPELLRRLIAQLLTIPYEHITRFEIRNTEITPDIIGKKFCRLDINMAVDGQNVNLEVQVDPENDYPERALFYWARMYSNALPVRGKYLNLPRTIIISILDFPLFKKCEEYHSEFRALEVTRNTPLTDKLVLHFFELPKIPGEIDSDDRLLQWLSLFNAKTEEDLERIVGLGVPELSEAVNAYHRVTTSPEYQELERIRIMAEHDEAQALYVAEQRGEKRGEKRGAAAERTKWQGVVADKDTEIEKQAMEIAKLKANIESLQKS